MKNILICILWVFFILMTPVLSIMSQWFVYGLWPQDWFAFVFLWIVGVGVGAAITAIPKFLD